MDSLLRDIRERDARDAGRAAAPLKPAADAVVLDTTNMTIDAAIVAVLGLVPGTRAAGGGLGRRPGMRAPQGIAGRVQEAVRKRFGRRVPGGFRQPARRSETQGSRIAAV